MGCGPGSFRPGTKVFGGAGDGPISRARQRFSGRTPDGGFPSGVRLPRGWPGGGFCVAGRLSRGRGRPISYGRVLAAGRVVDAVWLVGAVVVAGLATRANAAVYSTGLVAFVWLAVRRGGGWSMLCGWPLTAVTGRYRTRERSGSIAARLSAACRAGVSVVQ